MNKKLLNQTLTAKIATMNVIFYPNVKSVLIHNIVKIVIIYTTVKDVPTVLSVAIALIYKIENI